MKVGNVRGAVGGIVSATSEDILGRGGVIAQHFGDGYESRPQQASMARAIERAFEHKSCLLVEAGTGVGKSFAYLVPAIRRIVERGERVIVSTNTIALQEQLVSKDIPLLQDVFRGEDGEPAFRAELVKGRGNYLSIRRLQLASSRQDRLFVDETSRRTLHTVEEWAYATTDGTLSTLPQLERPGVWDRVQSDSGNCMGRRCPTYEQCFYQQARRRMERAHLLVCNHALFFSDLALRSKEAGFLPEYAHVVLDEAHMIEEVASEHFGLSVSEGRVRHLLSVLLQPTRNRGFLATLACDDEAVISRAIRLVHEAEAATDFFFERVGDLNRSGSGSTRLREPGRIENRVTPAFAELAIVLRRLREHTNKEEDRYELNAYAERASDIASEARALVDQDLEGCAYWVESSRLEGRRVRSTISCSPIDVAPILSDRLFGSGCSVVLTSATLTTTRGSFEHTKRRLGCEEAESVELGSPFDHASQAELYVDRSMPDPRDARYIESLGERVLRHVHETNGGAFVLFTSFDTMYRAADAVRGTIEAAGHPVFVQGRDGSRTGILDAFRTDERSVLFGTSSFWQGVDVRGRGLRNVIITRLPFDPPDRPLTQARLEQIEERGGNPFMEDSLPRAVIRFKQGFGRLIRSASDTGRVVILDPRIVTARYGRAFLDALPDGVRIRLDGAESGEFD